MAKARIQASESAIAAILGVALTEIDNAASFYSEGKYQGRCAACDATGDFEVHHALQKQRCRREGAPLHSPDDALRVCSECHDRHTSHQELLPLVCLRDENIAFTVRWLGTGGAFNYLTRYYAGPDPRVDAILEQPS